MYTDDVSSEGPSWRLPQSPHWLICSNTDVNESGWPAAIIFVYVVNCTFRIAPWLSGVTTRYKLTYRYQKMPGCTSASKYLSSSEDSHKTLPLCQRQGGTSLTISWEKSADMAEPCGLTSESWWCCGSQLSALDCSSGIELETMTNRKLSALCIYNVSVIWIYYVTDSYFSRSARIFAE